MIRFALHVLLFVLSFGLNISVRADVELPDSCAGGSGSCAVQAQSLRMMESGPARVRLGAGSSYVRRDANSGRLVRGLAAFEMRADPVSESGNGTAPGDVGSGSVPADVGSGIVSADVGEDLVPFNNNQVSGKADANLYFGVGIIIETLYGKLRATRGEFVVEAKDNMVYVYNVEGDLHYEPRGEKVFHSLPAGFSVFMAPVGTKGLAMTGFPKPIEIQPMIKRWSQLHLAEEKSTFRNKLSRFTREWRQAVEVTGPWYRDIIEREIASQKEDAERLARERARREAENEVFRRMFRSRIFDP